MRDAVKWMNEIKSLDRLGDFLKNASRMRLYCAACYFDNRSGEYPLSLREKEE